MPENFAETPETQDLDELARRIDAALAEARRTMRNLPAQVEGMEEPTGALPALTEGPLPQMEESGAAIADFGEARDANAQELADEPG